MLLHRRAKEGHAPEILAHADDGESEGRVHDAAGEIEADAEPAKRIEVRGRGRQRPFEETKHWLELDTDESVVAASQPGGFVGGLESDDTERQRHHQKRQIAQPQHERPGHERHDSSDGGSHDRNRNRLVPAVDRNQSRRIGAEAEEQRVAERHHAGVAEHQIERHDEDRGHQDGRGEGKLIRE